MSASSQPPPSRTAHARSVRLMLVSAACFTANVLLIRALGQCQAVDIWLIVCARFAVGLVMVAVCFPRQTAPAHLWRNPRLIERGLVGGISVYGFYLTIVHLGAGRATFINTTYIIWGAIMAVLLLRERWRPALGVGAVASLGGLALLTHAFDQHARPGFYDLVAVATALGSAWVVVIIRRLHAREHTATIFAAQCVYGLLICGGPALVRAAPVSAGAAALLVLSGLCAGAGQLAMTRSYRDLGVAEGSLLQMVMPLGIMAGDTVFFGERFRAPELLGAALILAGTALPAFQHRLRFSD